MRAIIVVVFVIGAFVAGVFAAQIGPASADSHPPRKSEWQYQCFTASAVNQVTDRANKMGQNGWELVTSAGSSGETVWCFKRPLWEEVAR